MGYALGLGFAVLIVIGVPIGISLGLGSMLGLHFFSNAPLEIAAQRLIAGVRSFPLMAIPLYQTRCSTGHQNLFNIIPAIGCGTRPCDKTISSADLPAVGCQMARHLAAQPLGGLFR